jgi:hypothetical protein
MRRYALPSLVSFSSTAATSTRRLALRALAFFFLEGTTMPSWISILVCTSFRFPRISLFSALQQGVSFTAGCPQWRLASLCSYSAAHRCGHRNTRTMALYTAASNRCSLRSTRPLLLPHRPTPPAPPTTAFTAAPARCSYYGVRTICCTYGSRFSQLACFRHFHHTTWIQDPAIQ